MLAWALATKDFRFEYVAQNCDRLLPWQYSLAAFWVGQAGSLLLWAWFLALLAMFYRCWPGRTSRELREPAFGVLMAFLCFLMAIMVFGADPMQPSLVARARRRPASLAPTPRDAVHPPIVFLGYAAWGLPFALAVAALLGGRWTPRGRGSRGPGHFSPGRCWGPESSWAPSGPTKNSAGAATGTGIPWKTAP